MSGASSKKIIASNKKIFGNLMVGECLSMSVLFVFLLLRKFTYWIAIYISIELLVIFALYKFLKPEKRNTGEVPSANFSERGVFTVLFDLIYLSWCGKIFVLFSKWTVPLFLVILCICIYYEFIGRRRAHCR